MTRLRDICWACDGEGFTINGDCENCGASGMIMDDNYELLPIEELMLNTIVGVNKWTVTHVEPLSRYYFEHEGKHFLLRTWTVTNSFVRWTLFLENREKGTADDIRDGQWNYQHVHSKLVTAETGEPF
jgi:hypothetical protein